MSLQSIFGLPGETVGTIPMLYSNYELEVLLRTSNSCSAPRNWTDPHAFASQEPRDAYMYAAALLTLPRTTLLYAWMYDHNGAYRILRNVHVDVLDAADRLTMGGVRAALSALGAWPARRPIANANGKAAPAPAAVTTPSAKGLGSLLWPLMVVCPGLVTCYLALALVETAPLAAGWILLTGLLKAFCEVRVLVHSGLLAWRRRPQAAVQSLACSHGVPFMLGCHALALLRVAGALLPARVFLYLSFHLYGTWVPLVSAGITLMALRPNNANFLEGAMDGLLHLGHRAAEEMHPTANGAANGGGNNTTLKNRQHWPPPVKVPAEMQESAELAPKHLLCPITHHILTEPAVTSTGATYERSAIVEWLTKAGKDPLTGRVLSPNEVFPNLAMYHVVEEYVRDSAKSQGKMSAATAAGR
ncbi:hypothetical protein PLESTF_001323100 [Pleodorina starrii]|nr:hypothetical protein PLESTF_001323100 [Pleodorina starrii]